MGIENGVSVAEAKLIAQDAAHSALQEYEQKLPNALKPIMYEVAENVARRSTKDFNQLFCHIFGADLTNHDHVRDLQKDLYHLRDLRTRHEEKLLYARQEMYKAFYKWLLTIIFSAIAALLMLVGFKWTPPTM